MATSLLPAAGGSLTTTYATYYTVPAATIATVVMLHVSNSGTDGTTPVEVSVQWLDASSTNEARILGSLITVPAKASWSVLEGQKLVLGAGDVIQAKRSSTGTADITISVMEQT